jgi:hypothetical protein
MNLSLGLKRSSDLTSWQDMSLLNGDVSVSAGKLNLQITPQDNAAFYILEGN